MTIEEFWNQAFIANMHRLPPENAKKAADTALEICIKHWNSKCYEWAHAPQLWQEQNVGYVNLPEDVGYIHPLHPPREDGKPGHQHSEVPAHIESLKKPYPKRSSIKIKSK